MQKAKKLVMRYFAPAERTDNGWERFSLPLGNGFFGASVFGGIDRERIQFTTNTFANDFDRGGVSNFGEIFIDFEHNKITDYERGLLLDTGIVYSKYKVNDVAVERRAFVSYPDKVFAYKITTDNGTIDFNTQLYIPYLGDRTIEEGGRTGKITREGNVLVMRGTLPSRELIYEARLTLVTDGQVSYDDTLICVKKAKTAEIFYTLDTSYKLCPEVFLDGCHKAIGDDPRNSVKLCLDKAVSYGFDELYNRHLVDYTNLIGRVTFDLGGIDDGRSTEELLVSYQNGNNEPYLEELYYAYGRHLLVSSSRNGTMPASLQGVWTVQDKSPWSCGFWHNINVQMNYWPAFSTNLAETFEAYADYWKNYEKQASIHASKFIEKYLPDAFVQGEGECGWIIGTGAWAYQIEGAEQITGHSGPGTGGLTSKMFWDYYDFTRNMDVLKKYAYPAIHGMSKFFTKCIKNYDGRYLCRYSASPEQCIARVYPRYYRTVGCAFDQQFMYENAIDDIKCSRLLGVEDKTVEIEKRQLSGYGPVQIGYSGQIKEYDEEHFYGEIGEGCHRHISQLVALMPGSTITHGTPAWLDAARITLTLRGDKSVGWALAHRLNCWARVGDGEHTYLLLKTLLRERTSPNLWDIHPPFQIDGNFGATAGMTEMVLQSHEGYLSLLPAIPDAWNNISFKGLKARGNFTVDCEYENGLVKYCKIESTIGEKAILHYKGIGNKTIVKKLDGRVVDFVKKGEFIEFNTVKDETYIIENFEIVKKGELVTDLISEWTDNGVSLKWNSNKKRCAVYRAFENDSDYVLIGETTNDTILDSVYTTHNKARLTYKIVICEGEYSSLSEGELATMHPANELEKDRYTLLFNLNNQKF